MTQNQRESFGPGSAATRKKQTLLKCLKITLIYYIIGCLWIVFTDLLARRLFGERFDMFEVSVLKGLFYVTVTAGIIFRLIYSAISSLSESEASLRESERSKSLLLENLPGAAYRCSFDREWTMQFISEGCYELTGYRPESLLGNRVKSYNDLIVPEYREPIWNRWNEVLKTGGKFKGEYEIKTASGERKWVFEQGQVIYDRAGNITALEGLIIDISEQKKHEKQLLHISQRDSVTEFYNRRYFEEMVERDLNGQEDDNRAVVLLSMVRLNMISLTFGYQFSESLIREVAAALSPLADERRLVFRISFERFAFYCRGYREGELSSFCGEINHALSRIKPLQFIGCGIGILEVDSEIRDAESILRNASIAAERSVGSALFGCRIFDDTMKEQILREIQIKDELMGLHPAGVNGCLYLQYQPILNLRTNRIYGFEALARMKTDALGVVSPLEFIPIAEEMRLIGLFGFEILREAGAFFRRLERLGFGDMILSVNISLLQLVMDDFLEQLIRIMEETALPARNLCLEITESVFTDNYAPIKDKLKKIRSLGIKVAIDDFGAGYSSFAREEELRVDCLKLDKFFIDKLLSQNPGDAVTGDIIAMAHKLGHCVIAEGVEQEIQKRYLTAYGCDLMQGYLFSRPLDPDEAVAMLRDAEIISAES